jgi:hypothetical protein
MTTNENDQPSKRAGRKPELRLGKVTPVYDPEALADLVEYMLSLRSRQLAQEAEDRVATL